MSTNRVYVVFALSTEDPNAPLDNKITTAMKVAVAQASDRKVTATLIRVSKTKPVIP